MKVKLREYKKIQYCDAVNVLQGRDATQRYLNRLERWAHENLMKLSKAKCKVLHMSGQPQAQIQAEWTMD